MLREVSVYGLLISPLLAWVCIALVIAAALRSVLNRTGAYRYVWHRPLFDLALLVIVTGAVAAVSHWLDVL